MNQGIFSGTKRLNLLAISGSITNNNPSFILHFCESKKGRQLLNTAYIITRDIHRRGENYGSM